MKQESIWNEILEAARWAPSAYNAQPWRFEIDDDRVTLLSRPERWRPAVDPNHREALISLGALVESIRIVAGERGYRTLEEWLVRKNDDSEILRIALVPAGEQSSSRRETELMTSLRTWRREYRHEPIGADALDRISSAGGRTSAIFEKGSGDSRRLVDLAVEAAVAHANRRELYSELAPYLYHPRRNSDSAWGVVSPVAERRGLRAILWNRFSSPKRAITKGYRASTITDVRDLLNQAPALLTLKTEGDTPRALMEVGMAYQRVRMEAAKLGLATQPVSMLPQMAALGSVELPQEHEGLQMVIRLGVPFDSKEAPRSVREPLEAMLLTPGNRDYRAKASAA